MTFNLFAVKPKGDKPKANIFSIPSFTQEPIKEEKEAAIRAKKENQEKILRAIEESGKTTEEILTLLQN